MTQAITQAAAQAGSAALNEAPRVAARIAADQAASAASRMLFGPARRVTRGRPIDEIRLLTAGEGGGIPRVFGRGRVGGQVIWASAIREDTRTVASTRGVKGVRAAVESRATEYTYSVSVAIALCEGPLARLGRVWADGKPISLSDYQYRLYHGGPGQGPDALIEAVEGHAPAFQGIAYILFEDLPLAPFGNRIPQFNFEVVCPIAPDDPEALENVVRAVTIIPGSGEAVYATETVFEEQGEGVTRPLNRHNGLGLPDATASLDELQALFPNLEAVSLVVSWFGDDLRAGHCAVRPAVEMRDRKTEPVSWSVAGDSRATARLLGSVDGRPAYGGTPSDESVRQMIRELTQRGVAVTFHPFVLMDILPGNGLPDPGGEGEQPAFPWRGRITANVAADDGTDEARLAVDRFFDSYDIMVLHYAALCAEEGGVEAFLLGSELRGLTRLRDAAGSWPAVERLRSLAAAVRAILPSAKISYAADWSEYGAYQPADGTGDLLYPLDALWADGNIDFVAINNYFPLTDWREGEGHLDASDAAGPYDRDHLMDRIRGGEGFDWYYASAADRLAQVRTPINDTAYGEDHVFRPKDLWSWWSTVHTVRNGGVKGAATPWVPASRPIVFTEIGCAAIDKGPNQPNVFVDPKSSESRRPHFSTGARDDRAQRAFLEAQHAFWSDPANNPSSPVYGGPMVDAARMSVYAWDARPFPDFPSRGAEWADAGNWITGHWLNGRAGRVPLGLLIERIAADCGLVSVDASACDQLVSGLVLPGPMSGREAIEPLLDLFQLDAVARDGLLFIRPRTGRPDAVIDAEDLVDGDDDLPLRVERVQDEEIPAALSVTFADELAGFELRTVEVRDEAVIGGRTMRIGASVVLDQGEAHARARAILAEARAMRLRARFGLPEIADGIEPGSVLAIASDGEALTVRITQIEDSGVRRIDAVSTAPGVFVADHEGLLASPEAPPPAFGAPVFVPLDIPLPADEGGEARLWLAAFAEPWPGALAVHRGADEAGAFVTRLSSQCLIGRLQSPLEPGPAGRWDRRARLHIRLPAGSPVSIPGSDVLEGAHLCAVETASGWELLQFATASLQPDGSHVLSDLLRGRRGTEAEALEGAEAGARIVFLDGALPLPLPADRWGSRETLQAGPPGALPGAYPFVSAEVLLSGAGARPFAPVHLSAHVEAGTTTLRWIRRTRVGGDRFGPGDVPLGETEERYIVSIFDAGGLLLDTVTVAEPTVTFAQPAAASVTVAQVSSAHGPGRAAALAL